MFRSILKCVLIAVIFAIPADKLHADEKYEKFFEFVLINEELISPTALRFERTISWIIKNKEALEVTSKMHVTTLYASYASSVIPISFTIQRGGHVIYAAEPKNFSLEAIKSKEDFDNNERLVSLYVEVPQLQLGDQIQSQYSMVLKSDDVTASAKNWTTNMRPGTIAKRFEYTLTAPQSMKVNLESYGGLSLKASSDGMGRQVWKYIGTLPYVEAPTESAAPPFRDDIPTLLISTYSSWKEVGDYYLAGEAAAMRAGLSQKILAEIVGDAKSDRDIAMAAFRWIQLNLRYDATRISPENRLRPRDLDVVLASRTADCKEMVMVLKAVLTAKGIAAQTVAVHTDSYRSPKIPGFSFNHVMVYIPSLDLYVDSTNRALGFGVIGDVINGKPILKLGENNLEEIHAPSTGNAVDSIENIVVNSDGLIASDLKITTSGSATKFLSGRFPVQPISKQTYIDFLRKFVSKIEVDVATVHMSDEREKGGPLILSATGTLPGRIFTEKDAHAPLFVLPKSTGLGALAYHLPVYQVTPRQSPMLCRFSYTATDDVIYSLPEKYVTHSFGSSKMKLNMGVFIYEREILILKPNVVKIQRRLLAHSDRNICPASDYAIWLDFAREILKDYLTLPIRVSEKVRGE